MNCLLWLLLLCCCGNNNNDCCHNHNTCIQPRERNFCDLKEKETTWTPYMCKTKQEECGCEEVHHEHQEHNCCEHCHS